VVAAARNAVSHWREHVQTQTDLTAGKITGATAGSIWKRTRLGGPSDIAKLDAASAQLTAQGSCAGLTGPASSACLRRIAAMDAAVITGRAAAKDWADHLATMAAHKKSAGPVHAQQAWIDQWKAAPKYLVAFAAATAALSKAPACRPS
jgi:hypothetical protein